MLEFANSKNIKEYTHFIESHPKCSYGQVPIWQRVKPHWKWEGIFVRDRFGNICGALSLLIRKLPYLPFSIIYGCRGPVCNINDHQTISELISGAKLLAKKYKAYVIKLDPDISVNEQQFVDLLNCLGFKCISAGKNFEDIQPRFVFRLSLENKTELDLLSAFSQKTRYNIRRAERKGVEIQEGSSNDIHYFSKLMNITARRDGFVPRSEEYFQNMLAALPNNAKLFMAYYNKIPIAGAIYLTFGDKAWYLYGASANDHRELMPNYLLQWHMICRALSQNCRIYDFRGISGDISENNPLYGLYRFKKGFSGELTEFIGEFDFVVKPTVYRIIKTANKFRRFYYLICKR